MKYKKILFLTIPFLLVIAIIVYTPKSAETISYNEKKEKFDMDKYIEKNHEELDLDSGSGFNLLDEDIVKNDVILAGEYNAVSRNYQVKLSLLKYLNKNHNVRYLLDILSYSQSSLINEYLKSGDESKLQNVIQSCRGTILWNKEFYDFWVKLRKYNETLPESKKILVIGINLEDESALNYIYSLLSESEPLLEVKPYIKAYKDSYNAYNKNHNKENFDEMIKDIHNLNNNIEANPDIYERYLGKRYFDFCNVINNFLNTMKIYTSGETDNETVIEESIYNNFKRIYSSLPKGKYFGQFSMKEVYQNSCISNAKDTKVFAMYLNGSDSPVGGKVLSIAYVYKDSKALFMYENYEEAYFDSDLTNIDILNNVSRSDITLFKLNGEKSQFNIKPYFVTSMDNKPDTDYFKYIILIKNSKAATAYEK